MSIARQPRCILAVNGISIEPIECNVHLSLHQSADTFYAKLPIDASLGLDEAFWASTAPITFAVMASTTLGASMTTLIAGNMDQPQVIFHERAVEVRGRDKTATLTETKTSQLFRNQTDQQIIQTLAGQAGLSVQFTQSADSAGLQYDQDYSEIADSDTAWNKIVELAKKAGCIAFVKGTTLYVQPIDATPGGMLKVIYSLPSPGSPASSDAVMLFAARNLNLAKDTTVTLQSWQHKQGKVVTSSFQSKPKSASQDKVVYQHRAANLTKTQQDKIALGHLKETLSHERQIDLNNYPGDVTAIPGLMGLTLSGTGTQFDQDYILSDATHRFNNDGGYMMDLSAHSQDQSRGEPDQLQ